MEWLLAFTISFYLIGCVWWLREYYLDPTAFYNPKWYHHVFMVVCLLLWPITIPFAMAYDKWERRNDRY